MSVTTSGLSLWDRLQRTYDFVFKLPYYIVTGVFSDANKGRSWRRATADSTMRFITSRTWNIKVFADLTGQTGLVYQAWARENKLGVLSDDVGSGGKIHWIGPRRYDRVLLFFHGGGYSLSVSDKTMLPFLLAVQRELEKSIGGAGVVLLEHSLTPDFAFPTQLTQANAAITHLFSKGLSPSNLILSGDSAGGNLAFQVFSHFLHPFPSVPTPPALSAPIAGAALISPWVTFDSASVPSFSQNDKKDTVPAAFFDFLAEQVTPGLPEGGRPYAEPYIADDAWWGNLHKVVGRVLATAGEVECPRDAIVNLLSGPVKARVPDTTVVVEKNGVHEEMLHAFGAGEGEEREEYWQLVKWVSETFHDAQ